MNAYWLIPLLLMLALAWPVMLTEQSWARLIVAMFMSFVVVLLPLFVFFLSSFLVPEWKGACHHGWVDCFIVGKLALTPFVLVATAALYKHDVLGEKNLTDSWPVVAIYLGALVAVVCLVFGWACLGWQAWMWVPLYVAVWYGIRAGQLMKKSPVGFWAYFIGTLGTVPFWLMSWMWSSRVYESLPNQAPQGCFVVTAAGRGHRKLVGPFCETEHGGRRLQANLQLITLWEFENIWRKKSPGSHQIFRLVYNQIGPVIANHIRSPWLADATFIALKPAEWLACLCLPGSLRRKATPPFSIPES
jgi:hypothetical protein